MAGLPSKRALFDAQTPRSILGDGKTLFLCPVVNVGPILVPAQQPAVIAQKIKHKLLQKKSNLPPVIGIKPPPGGLRPQNIQPLATRAKPRQAIPGVSDWVLGIIAQGYTLQFARRPP